MQSAYSKHHSTESALLKVQNDIIISMDKGEVTALTLMSTSLTMLPYLIDFQIGMECLHTGRVKSGFLLTRHQSVKIKVTLSYGVPRGSVLGPVLFILYTTPLSTIISSFDINQHLCADNTQIYMSLSVSNAKESLEMLQHL